MYRNRCLVIYALNLTGMLQSSVSHLASHVRLHLASHSISLLGVVAGEPSNCKKSEMTANDWTSDEGTGPPAVIVLVYSA